MHSGHVPQVLLRGRGSRQFILCTCVSSLVQFACGLANSKALGRRREEERPFRLSPTSSLVSALTAGEDRPVVPAGVSSSDTRVKLCAPQTDPVCSAGQEWGARGPRMPWGAEWHAEPSVNAWRNHFPGL